MPKRLCPNGHIVRDKSSAFCPQCGAPMPELPAKHRRPKRALIAIGAIAFGILALTGLTYFYIARSPTTQAKLAPALELVGLPAPTPLPPKATHAHPCPPKQSCLVDLPGQPKLIMYTRVIMSGTEATNYISLWSDSNPPPRLGTEYLLVGISVRYLEGSQDVIALRERDFATVDKYGSMYGVPKLTGNGDACDFEMMRNSGGKCLLPVFRSAGVTYLVYKMNAGGGAWFYLD